MGMDTWMFRIFSQKGYQYFGTATNRTIFPPRIGTFIQSRPTVAKKVSYWITRPHTSKTRLPIVYFHGIGIGLITYAQWIQRLDEALNRGHGPDDQVGIVMMELPYISSRLSYHSIPRREVLLREFTTILDHHQISKFVLAGHSYGSIFSTYILRDPKLSSRVVSSLLVDPVAIMLHMPDVAYNFTVRAPTGANEWQLWYFASKDPGVAHTLGRLVLSCYTVLAKLELTRILETSSGMKMCCGETRSSTSSRRTI
jgi:pimeloyl-ACP methyl ester carboxylesterase